MITVDVDFKNSICVLVSSLHTEPADYGGRT